jgi:hypothetical protein
MKLEEIRRDLKRLSIEIDRCAKCLDWLSRRKVFPQPKKRNRKVKKKARK